MTAQQEIEEHQARIKALNQQIANCHHDFKDAIYDPDVVKEPYGFKTVGQGSDIWTEPTGFHDVSKARWSRECKKCGYKQYTTKSEPIISGTKPKF